MSIDRLRYFAAVVETLNLRKASELMGISPPSMSKAISVLEGELGHQLIYPDGRGIGITEKGFDVYTKSAKVLEEYKRFFQNLESNDTPPATLRIATFEVFSTYFLANFLVDNPEYEVLHLEKTPGFIEESVLSGMTDIGITYMPALDPKLEFSEIGSFKNSIYGSRSMKNLEFSKLPFAIPTTEMSNFTSDIDSLDMWPRTSPKRKVKYRMELLETALQLSSKDLAVLHCPDFVASLYNRNFSKGKQLVTIEKPKKYGQTKIRKIYMVSRKGSSPLNLEGKLAKFMRSLN